MVMTRTKAWPISRVTQQLAWWTFLVSSLFAGGVTWLGGRAGQPLVTEDEFTVYHGSYQPLNGATVSKAYETSLEINTDIGSPTADVVRTVSLSSFVILLIASVVLAALLRRPVPSAGAIVVPLVAATIVAVALPGGRWGAGLDNTWSMVVVLAAVALHLLWTHILRTRFQQATATATT